MSIDKTKAKKEKAFASIGLRSFLTVIVILCVLLAIAGSLSYFLPQGSYEKDAEGVIIEGSYKAGETVGIPIWRVLTAPLRVFASSDALTIIMISVFLLIMSGVFNILEKTSGVRVLMSALVRKLSNKKRAVIAVSVLFFMLFGSLFGMFEELVTLLPLTLVLMLSLGFDSMTGLGVCMLSACFGFASAITNPFSVGIASQVAGTAVTDGVWLRLVFFALIYGVLILFLLRHVAVIRRDPLRSPTYDTDKDKRLGMSVVEQQGEGERRTLRIYAVFFIVQAVVLLLIATVSAISSLAIPLLAISFLFGGLTCGFLLDKPRHILRFFGQGAVAMLPAVVMIAFASSVKFVIEESGVMDTLIYYATDFLTGKGPFVTVLLVYALILFLQFFIGSASAKILLVMPMILPICEPLGISPSLIILVYCMADGFTDMIIPTNPILLVGLSMGGVSYGKWFKWTWKLQAILLLLTVGILYFATVIGY